MNPLDAYLNEVSYAMGGSFSEQQAARDELRAHVEEGAHDLELAGVPREEALLRAIGDLGTPEAVGRGLRGSRGSGALRRPVRQGADGVLLGLRRDTHHVPARIILALAAFAAVNATVALIYLWP